MKDYETGVLEQYHIEVNSTRKIRGAVLCDTAQGWFLLKEAGVSLKRISMLQKLYENLQETGLRLVDRLIENTEGNLISIGEDGKKYWLKQWFCGRECDIRKEYELTEAVKNLTGLHSRLRGMFPGEEFQEINLCEEYQRHNRELKKVRSFIRQKVGKGDFETAFLNCFDPMYEWADSILNQFRQSGYQELYRGSKEQGCMIHGEYNYHNLLMTTQGIATTNFEHFQMDIQMADLYYFLRKAMEKHQWNEKLGDCILNTYSRENALTHQEMEYLALRIAYPEKFWKIANTYYHSNKAWIPVKNLEKLQTEIRQTEEKQRFLQNIFAFHL